MVDGRLSWKISDFVQTAPADRAGVIRFLIPLICGQEFRNSQFPALVGPSEKAHVLAAGLG